ncbi:MAG: ArnT family glycosyltransferase, partial [Blastocatellia bacterium]
SRLSSISGACQQISLAGLFEDRRFHVCLIAVMSLLALFPKLHLGDLGGYDAAVYAHEGKRMLATGQWWTVYLNGQPDFDKPPMFIWLEALSMMVFGVSDFAARFPSAMLGFGSILLVYFIARELTTSYWTPVWAMMVLFSTQFFMRYAMRAMTDVPFTFFLELALLFYLIGLRRNKYLILCGLAISFAVLMRSFLGLIPLGIIVAHLTFSGRVNLLRSKYFIAGMLLAAGLPLVWFVSQYQIHGSKFLALHFSFTFDNLPLTNGKPAGQFGAGLLQYPRFLLESYWPWLPLMVVGMWTQTKKVIDARDSASCFLIIWILALIASFSLAEFKWLRYILPAFPAFAILSAITLNDWIPAHHRRFFLKAVHVVLCLTMVGLALNPKYRVRPEEMRRLAPVAEAATGPEQRILLYTERAPRDAHMFQIIWYADRYCELLSNADDAIVKLKKEPNAAVIMDKEIFRTSIIPAASAADQGIKILGETEGFVCWTKVRQSAPGAPNAMEANPVEARNNIDSAPRSY